MYYRGQHGPQNLSGIFLKEFPQTTTSEPTFYVGLPESGGSVPTIGSDFVAEQEYPEFRQPEYYSDANTYAIHDRWIQHGNNQFGVYTGATQEQLADPALQSYADPDWLPQQTAPFYAAVETWSEIAPNRYGGAPQSLRAQLHLTSMKILLCKISRRMRVLLTSLVCNSTITPTSCDCDRDLCSTRRKISARSCGTSFS